MRYCFNGCEMVMVEIYIMIDEQPLNGAADDIGSEDETETNEHDLDELDIASDETLDDDLETDTEMEMEAEALDPAPPSTPSPAQALEGLDVCVDFRIGEITMPVNKLENLAPGWTLTDLPGITFPRAVALSAGRSFAEGELVDIDGKIGFRITKLLP